MRSRSLPAFFALVVALAVPFWAIGAVTGLQLLPGIPLAALATVCPAIAAVALVYRKGGRGEATALLMRALDFDRIAAKRWYLPALLLIPAVGVLAFWVMRLSGTAVPAPRLAALPTLALCGVFFLGAVGEELGWSGYAIDPMQDRWGVLRASLVLGCAWAVYHYVGLVQAHRSVAWIAWWSLGTVSTRVILVWLYDGTGRSVFATSLCHMTVNVTWQSFPIQGSYYDPRIFGTILAAVAIAVGVGSLGRRSGRRCVRPEADAPLSAP
ncbi:MAG: CPBP family intramembrane glutamic endopeptidase [Myxococcales bacterium]